MKIKPVVFVNYARENLAVSKEIFDTLGAAGFDPFIDKEDLRGGQEWPKQIAARLRKARFFVACVSELSAKKGGFVQQEIDAAAKIADEVPSTEFTIIPVRMEPCDLPAAIGKYQRVDWFEPNAHKRLVDELRSHLPAEAFPWWLVAAAACVVALIALAYPMIMARWQVRVFVKARDKPPEQLREQSEVRMGVTVWSVRRVASADPPGARMIVSPARIAPNCTLAPEDQGEWVPDRASDPTRFQSGGRFRVGVESSVEGFVYAVGEQLAAGSQGAPVRLFPDQFMPDSPYRLDRGRLALIPSEACTPFWKIVTSAPGYQGDSLTVILSESAQTEAQLLAGIGEWRRMSSFELVSDHSGGAGVITSGEQGARQMTAADPAPQRIYRVKRRAGVPALVTVEFRPQ